MSHMIGSFKDVIEQWPGGLKAFAAAARVTPNNAKQMRRRDRIPDEHWLDLMAEARAMGIGWLSYEVLASLAAKKKSSEIVSNYGAAA